jgi:hypothetical protein
MAGKLTLVILLLIAAIGVAPRTAMGSCSLETKRSFTQGEPVVLKLVLDNNTFEPAVFDLGYDREGALLFRLNLPDGSSIDLPQKQVREGISRVGKLSLAAQEKYSQQLVLDDWYKFKDAGTYRVSLTIQNTCGPMQLPIEITPFDADVLSSVCRQLLDTIRQNKNDYAKAADAANVLARVNNPLAVPFLKKALQANPMVDWIVNPAIERLAPK